MPKHPHTNIRNLHDRTFTAEMLIHASFFAAGNAVFVVQWETHRILACNTEVNRVFGYTPEELRGRSTAHLHIDDGHFREFQQLSEKALQEGRRTLVCRSRMRRKDGSEFHTENLLNFITDETDEPVAAVSIVHDLSSLSRSAETLPAGLNINALTHNLPGGVFQRIKRPGERAEYTFLRGNILQRIGVDPVEAQQNPEVLLQRMHADDRPRLLAALERSERTLEIIDIELRFFDIDGNQLWLRSLSQPRRLDDGSVAWDGIILDISGERRAVEHMRYLAFHDALTGLPNQHNFRERLRAAVERSDTQLTRIIVAAINLRRMHVINETYGQQVADEVLRETGRRIADVCDDHDRVARSHGDEFLVMFPDVPGTNDPLSTVQCLFDCFERPFYVERSQRNLAVAASIGMAVYPADGGEPDILLRNADTALSRARRSGPPNFTFYTESMTEELIEQVGLEQALRDALAGGELVPFYQPQFDLADGSLVGFEALARWQAKDGHWISPGKFIPLAKETGMIGHLGRLITENVIADIRRWSGVTRPLPVAINFSGLHFREKGFQDWYLQSLVSADISSDMAQIEVTESTFMQDLEQVLMLMEYLGGHGVRFSIDDFGTGYSSLSYLSQLPFNILKIDRSFINGVGEPGRKTNLVKSLIQMSRSMGLYVIAEGVEDGHQAAWLREFGCDGAQGYFFGRPAPTEAALELLKRRG